MTSNSQINRNSPGRIARTAALTVFVGVQASTWIPAAAQYTEAMSVWTATGEDAWETVDLTGTVPANAVLEIAVYNRDPVNSQYGGVRAVGSSLDRRLLLHRAEDTGSFLAGDFIVMHVQADSSSDIQQYSSQNAFGTTFALLGYWTSGTYVERFDTFTAGSSGAWVDKNLCSYGVRPGYVVEIAATNDDPNNETEAGIRTNGSSLSRIFDLHESEPDGVDAVSAFVKADTTINATIEVYAETNGSIDFYVLGYWSVAPGSYTEAFTDIGNPSTDATWEDIDLTASGLPNSAVAEFVMSNNNDAASGNMGVRANGSALNRYRRPHEGESGGSDFYRAHVLSDGTATIEFYHATVSQSYTFRLVGYWSTCNSSVSYTVQDLGAVTASNKSLGWRINGSEHVAGFEETSAGNPSAWLLNCGSFSSLSTLGGSYAESQGINDSDMVVGWSHNGSGKRRAFRWTSGGGMVDLGTVSGRTDSEALSVNSSSEIVGTVMNFGSPPSTRLAFLYLPADAYTLTSGMNSLGTLGGTQSVATDINNSGRVVGGAQNAGGNYRPFRWNSGTMTDLGTLGGDSVYPDHRAEAVNSSGNIVGRSYTAGAAARAFYWNGTTMANLGVLTGGTESWAFGINDSNVVVGTSNVTGGAFHAFVYDTTNGLRDLNNLIAGGSGWTLIRATDINNEGFITGWGTNGSGDTRAFMLTLSCYAGGGGAAAAGEPIASGGGITDESGAFDASAVSAEGIELAHIEVLEAEIGTRVEYQIIEPLTSSDPIPEPGVATRAGFVDGIALGRTLKVDSSAATGEFALTVTMNVTQDQIDELGTAPQDLEIHAFDASLGGGVWIPAGKNIGLAPPTEVNGQSGYVPRTNGAIEYWTVRDAGGTFAVGKGTVVDQEAPQPNPVGAPTTCGLGWIIPMFASILTWLTARTRRHKLRFANRTPGGATR